MSIPRILSTLTPTFLLVISLFCTPSFAQSDGPVNITGAQFDIDENQNIATFTGDVVVVQKTFTLWAPRVIAYYGEGGPSELKEITADGRIRVEYGTQTAISDHGIYDPKTKIVRMIGNVSVTQADGSNAVNSEEMVIDLANDTTRFVGTGKDDGRVTAVFGSDN
ncbi:LptA/OstA family protein [Maritalea sp.]|uniref:LptA/OstA family protein n=1 Tax=Maritalea sp. TaxID=2003361 RepID=UPI003EF660F6